MKRDSLSRWASLRQRNVVPEDSLRNAATLDALLLRGEVALTLAQRIGCLVLGCLCLGSVIIITATWIIPLFRDGTWGDGIISIPMISLFGFYGIRVIMSAILAPSARARKHFPAE